MTKNNSKKKQVVNTRIDFLKNKKELEVHYSVDPNLRVIRYQVMLREQIHIPHSKFSNHHKHRQANLTSRDSNPVPSDLRTRNPQLRYFPLALNFNKSELVCMFLWVCETMINVDNCLFFEVMVCVCWKISSIKTKFEKFKKFNKKLKKRFLSKKKQNCAKILNIL